MINMYDIQSKTSSLPILSGDFCFRFETRPTKYLHAFAGLFELGKTTIPEFKACVDFLEETPPEHAYYDSHNTCRNKEGKLASQFCQSKIHQSVSRIEKNEEIAHRDVTS